ncbi:hypothetical protein RQP46_004282 [Phenoliferia psychrophenolica]
MVSGQSLVLIRPRNAGSGAGGINLGRAGEYDVLANSAITVGASSVITGNVGISPGTAAAITIPNGLQGPVGTGGYYTSKQVVGKIWQPGGQSDTDGAMTDLVAAYNYGMALTPSVPVDSQGPLGGGSFTPGTYAYSAGGSTAAGDVITLTGKKGDVFIFKTATTLIFGASTTIKLVGGVLATDVYWVVGTALTTSASSTLAGMFICGTAATTGATSTFDGGIFAQTAITIAATNTFSTCTDPHAATCNDNYSTSCVAAFKVSNGYCVPDVTAPNLGAACQFTLLGSSAITFGATDSVSQNIGIYPGTAITMPAPGIVYTAGTNCGTAHPYVAGVVCPPGSLTSQAHSDFLNAYDFAMNQQPTQSADFYPATLGGQTFQPGVYKWTTAVSTAASMTVTLNGNKGDVFIMNCLTLDQAASSTVLLTGGLDSSSVYWVSGSTINVGATANFAGYALCGSASTIGANTNIDGSIFAQSAITLGASVNMVNPSGCASRLSTSAAARMKRNKVLEPRWDRPVVRSIESPKKHKKHHKAHAHARLTSVKRSHGFGL